MALLTKEFLAEQIAHHQKECEAHVLSYERARVHKVGDIARHLTHAAEHAAIFTALSTIAAVK